MAPITTPFGRHSIAAEVVKGIDLSGKRAMQMVMQAKLPYTVLRDGVLTHPTMTEGLNLLFSKL
jgi:hypothetical protein